MYDRVIRYLASVFVDAASIRATPTAVAGLVALLDDERLLPISVEEQGPSGRIPRIGFQAPDGAWQLLLLGERFNVAHYPTDPFGSNMLAFQQFCQYAGSKLAVLLRHFGRQAHRLAAVEEGFLPELTREREVAVRLKLVSLPPTMADHPPFEWDWRAAALIPRIIAGLEEGTNTILTAKRVTGTFRFPGEEEASFERIRLDVDVNTSPANTMPRFDEAGVLDFFGHVADWHASLSEEFLAFVGLGGGNG